MIPLGVPLPYCTLADIFEKLKAGARYDEAAGEVVAFNVANRWVKQGLSLVPMK